MGMGRFEKLSSPPPCGELKSTSVKKGCTKSKKTPKFGVGAI